jgi:2-polyprenyl-3-methyl-5-hydroxy-6-metoxy-1,4-benzoquinol methylase
MTRSKTPSDDTASPDQIVEIAVAFQRCRVLLTAYELDLFTALGEEEKSSSEVAKALGTDARATDRLMNALCALELLEKKEGLFANTPLASRFLIKGKPQYLAGLMHIVHLWETWSTLTQAVQRGQSVVTAPINKRSEDWFKAFIEAMNERAKKHAPVVVDMLDLSGVSTVLDVGGGSGAYSIAFVRAREGIRATVFDLPKVIHLTNGYISQEGLSDKINTITGDFDIDDIPGRFDLVFLSAIIHSNSPEQIQTLLRKSSNALNPGGQIVIQDFIMDEDRTTPAFGTTFSLNMLVGTEAGDTYTESEVRTWMEEAGFIQIQKKDTIVGTALVIGIKS